MGITCYVFHTICFMYIQPFYKAKTLMILNDIYK